jgi:hypothetical protein
MPMASADAPRHATVFGTANEDLKEAYVAWTSLPIFQAIANLGKHLPSLPGYQKPHRQNYPSDRPRLAWIVLLAVQ